MHYIFVILTVKCNWILISFIFYRYVQYFAGLLSGTIRINSSPLYLHTLTLYGVPHFEPTGGCHLFVKVIFISIIIIKVLCE